MVKTHGYGKCPMDRFLGLVDRQTDGQPFNRVEPSLRSGIYVYDIVKLKVTTFPTS